MHLTNNRDRVLGELTTEVRALREDFAGFRKTLFGENGRGGITADVESVKMETANLRASLQRLWPIVVAVAIIAVYAGGVRTVEWVQRLIRPG